MNFLNKNTRNKIISQALIGVSIFGLGTGCNSIINPPIQVNALSTTATINEITYTYEGTTATITKVSTSITGNLVIPSIITINGTLYSVTSIGDSAFNKCTGLTSINIPNSITSIGNRVFNECTGLTSVTIQNTGAYITDSSFEGCAGLTTYGLGNIVYTLNKSIKTATISTGTLGVPSTIKFNGNVYNVIIGTGTTPSTLLADAQAKVVNAENTKTQTDINTAQTAIGKLASGTDKYNLQTRLDNVLIILYAIDDTQNLLNLAKTTMTQNDIDNAQIAINNLPDGVDKTNLQKELNSTKNEALIWNATVTVANAENTKTQTDINTAQTAIDKLADGTDKANLQSKLDKIKTGSSSTDTKLADAQAKVSTAESTKLWRDLNDATTAINNLPSSLEKDTLQSIIDKIVKEKTDCENQLYEATNAVIKVEFSILQSDVDNARVLVNSLPENTEKTNLLSRLRYIQDVIYFKDAKSKLKIAEETKTKSNINIAQIAIDKLFDGVTKTDVQLDLDTLKTQISKEIQDKEKIQDATLKVKIAEASVKLSSINTYIANAQIAIDNISGNESKSILQERLNKINVQIANNMNKDLIKQAEPLVKFAVLFKTTKYKTQAWDIVNKITPCAEKTAFINKLNSISV